MTTKRQTARGRAVASFDWASIAPDAPADPLPPKVETVKLRNRITALRKSYPRIGPARYLYATSADLKHSGPAIVVLTVLWSDDGRVSLHRTVFDKKRAMDVHEWADWLKANVPEVLRNSVLAYVNRSFGSFWAIDRLFGWHFVNRRGRPRRGGIGRG